MDLSNLSDNELISLYKDGLTVPIEKVGEEIYNRHKYLIYNFCTKFEDRLKSEARSVATETLFNLIKKFDPSKKSKFSTYFHSHLNYLRKEIYRKNFPYTISDYYWKKRNKYLHNSIERVFHDVRSKTRKKPASLFNMEDLQLEWEEAIDNLNRVLAKLSPTELEVIKGYYGLDSQKLTKKQLSEKLKISTYSVGKILEKSLKKLSQYKNYLYLPE